MLNIETQMSTLFVLFPEAHIVFIYRCMQNKTREAAVCWDAHQRFTTCTHTLEELVRTLMYPFITQSLIRRLFKNVRFTCTVYNIMFADDCSYCSNMMIRRVTITTSHDWNGKYLLAISIWEEPEKNCLCVMVISSITRVKRLVEKNRFFSFCSLIIHYSRKQCGNIMKH